MSTESKIIKIERQIYKQVDYENEYRNLENGSKERDEKEESKLRRVFGALNPLNLLKLFTIVRLFVDYDIKGNLLSDLISGLTVGVMNIPAGINLNFYI